MTAAAAPAADPRTRLRELVLAHGFHQAAPGKKILGRGGDPLLWLFDLRAVFMRPEALELCATLFWEHYQNKGPLQVAGMEVAAIPLVIAIILQGQARGYPCNGLIIRKERKNHGLGRILEGDPTDAPVVLVDDLLNSGASLAKARAVLHAEGLTVLSHFVVLDFRSDQGQRWRTQAQAEVVSLLDPTAFEVPRTSPAPTLPVRQDYTPLWRFAAPRPNPYYVIPKSAPVHHQGKLIFGSDDAAVHAVDAHTGHPLWLFQCEGAHAKGIFSTPAVHGDWVYFGAYNGNFYCLNANTGEQIWAQPCCEWIGSSPVVVPEHNLVYVGLEYAKPRQQGSVAAFDLEAGRKVWEQGLQVYQHGSGAWCSLTDSVIFGTNDHTVVSFNAADGKVNWVYDLPRSVKYAPAVDNTRGLCAFTSFDGGIYLIDAVTGATRWRVQTGNICYTTPLIVGDTVFAGSGDQHFYAIDLATGQVRLKSRIGARIYGSPRFIPYDKETKAKLKAAGVISPGSVVFGAANGLVYELDVSTFRLTGRLAVPDAVTNAITVLDDGRTLVVPTYQNELYAFRREVSMEEGPPRAPTPDDSGVNLS